MENLILLASLNLLTMISRKVIAVALLISICATGVTGQSKDYFKKSTPEARGIPSESILEFVNALEEEIDAVHSFMILRHGKLVSQGWWDPYGPELPHLMHSLSKSFTSTAIGLAVEENLLSLDSLVISFFPDKVPGDLSWQWKEMRIRDLLTMNTGHLEEPRPGPDQDDWVMYFLSSEVELMPGTHFRYNSMATYMCSAIIQVVSGEKLVDYLDSRLFQPLGIQKPEWDECPAGINTGGWGLHIRTEDIAKLGQLYLQKGLWEGERILTEEWVDMATSKQVSNGSNPDNDWTQGYGFQFWRCRHYCYRGDGAFGQFCIVMPEQEAVIAITSGTNDMGGVMQLIWNILLPAMKDGVLPENPPALSLLEKKTRSLALPVIKGESHSSMSKKISGKRYTMDANPAGINAVSFELHQGDHSMKMETDSGSFILRIGSGAYEKSETELLLPAGVPGLAKIAASGAWVTDNDYTLRIYFNGAPARVTYHFDFKENEMKWSAKLEHSLFGPREPIEMTGTM